MPAPPVLEFDPAGNLVGHWGGPGEGYEWPNSNHGITVDHKGNVWIGGNGRGDDPEGIRRHADPEVHQRRQVPDADRPRRQEHRQQRHGELQGPAKIFVDPKANEVYVADGYGNKRVVVIDADTGKFKRYWGAYGNKPDDTNIGRTIRRLRPPSSSGHRSTAPSCRVDGLLYVCDRPNDRIQVFKPDGTFVKEVFIAKNTLGDGSVWDIAFSKDPEQRFMYVADGKNEKVYIIQRDTMEILTSFGDGGRQPGQFFAVHSIATDSKGNIYTTETYEGKRLQKFVFKGIGAVPRNQGAGLAGRWRADGLDPKLDLRN